MGYHIMKTTFTSAGLNVQSGCYFCLMIQYMIYVGICTNTALQNGNCLHIQKLLHAESLLTTFRYQMSYFYVKIKIQF